MEKEQIITEIIRTSATNGGNPLGIQRFSAATGIRSADWQKYWPRWGDALREAGLQPNKLNVARSDDDVLLHLANLAKELGRFPVANEIRIKARNDSEFPWHNTFAKFGNKAALALRLRRFCHDRGLLDIAAMCDAVAGNSAIHEKIDNHRTPAGYVYLVQHGSRREFKIGRTNNPLRREGEIRLELPEDLQPIHTIPTDDPAGIERYWHQRFSNKRKNGEWFALDSADIQAFKRWKKIF